MDRPKRTIRKPEPIYTPDPDVKMIDDHDELESVEGSVLTSEVESEGPDEYDMGDGFLVADDESIEYDSQAGDSLDEGSDMDVDSESEGESGSEEEESESEEESEPGSDPEPVVEGEAPQTTPPPSTE